MFGNKTPMLSEVVSSMLGGENIETLFTRQVADENNWRYIGYENDCYKFHDVINDKEIVMSVDQCLAALINAT